MAQDLTAVFSHQSRDSGEGLPDAIMLPKCDTAEQLAEVRKTYTISILACQYH